MVTTQPFYPLKRQTNIQSEFCIWLFCKLNFGSGKKFIFVSICFRTQNQLFLAQPISKLKKRWWHSWDLLFPCFSLVYKIGNLVCKPHVTTHQLLASLSGDRTCNTIFGLELRVTLGLPHKVERYYKARNKINTKFHVSGKKFKFQ